MQEDDCGGNYRSVDSNSKNDVVSNEISLDDAKKIGREKKIDDAIRLNSSKTPTELISHLKCGRKEDERGIFMGEKSEGQRCRIPLDYELLPEKFFPFRGIPLPLVSKSWLKSNEKKLGEVETLSHDESEDDSLPLARIKVKLKEAHSGKSSIEPNSTSDWSSLNKNGSRAKNDGESKRLGRKQFKTENGNNLEKSVINRKRGRPRKSEKVTLPETNDKTNSFDTHISGNFKESEDDFWAESENSLDLDLTPSQSKLQGDELKEDNINGEIRHREHNYFKLNDNLDVNGEEECNRNDTAVKKREKNLIQGVISEDKKISYPCLECGKSYSAASTLRNHKRIHNGTLLKCTECHKGFITKYLLKCHMRIHNGDLFTCCKCEKGFTTAELLKVHSRGHTGDRPFACNICGRSFSSASNLSQHKQTHNTEKKFLCFQCGSSFSQKRCLDGHMLTHAEKNHICNVCGKLWARKSDLIEHMRVHTGVKPYCCSICPQKFTQASSLKRHQIVHMDIKPIQCMTCSKMFKCQEYYDRHIRKHEKEAVQLIDSSTEVDTII